MKITKGLAPTKWNAEQGGDATLNLIKKAFVPAAAVAAFLMLLGAVGNANVAFADDLVEIVPDGGIVAPGEFAVYAVVDGDEDTWTVEIDSESGSADIVGVLEGEESGDIDTDVNSQEVLNMEAVDLCGADDSLLEDLEALGVDVDGIEAACEDEDDADFPDIDFLVVLVVIDCDDLGTFDISFVNEDDNDEAQSAEFDCRGNADSGEISVSPSKVEIIPQLGSTDTSTITVEIFDDNDQAAIPGDEVLFLTDNCGFADNSGKDSINVISWDDDGDTIAEVDLDCSNSSTATPGPANVTAIIEKSGSDIVLNTTVTVVGPPVANGITVEASPVSGLVCGEKATIVVTVLDSDGHFVSDNTPLSIVTNFGGVLGGTGAVALGGGLVTPLSSTVAMTNGGSATFFLITSDTHEGNYEVLVSTGNLVSTEGGIVAISSAPITTQVSVDCSAPTPPPAPTITAPSTGGGITPPSTGDAGLASTSGSSWMLLAMAGALAFVVAAVGVGSPSFFRR